jgi:hypothetical protein
MPKDMTKESSAYGHTAQLKLTVSVQVIPQLRGLAFK